MPRYTLGIIDSIYRGPAGPRPMFDKSAAALVCNLDRDKLHRLLRRQSTELDIIPPTGCVTARAIIPS